jgi:sphingolipid delta-4 desaturase
MNKMTGTLTGGMPAGTDMGRISPQALRHNAIRRDVLRRSPEVGKLSGANPWTALALPVLLALHWGMAWLVGWSGSILFCFAAAFFFGQIVIHAGGALLHESAHRLVFRRNGPKLAFDLGLELLLGSFGKQLTYQYEHVSSHHPHLGDYERDYEHEDICSFNARRSIKARNPALQHLLTGFTLFLHALPFGFLVSDVLLPRLYRSASHQTVKDASRHIDARQPPPKLKYSFIAVSLALNVFLIATFGWLGWLYHNWSLSLFLGKMGVSNLGQSLSEHDGDDDRNPTYSDYRAQNLILFNTGYHAEHHTFPNVAWNRLPRLREAAPDVFNRENPRNYAALWWRHVREDFSPTRRNRMMAADLSGRCPPADA